MARQTNVFDTIAKSPASGKPPGERSKELHIGREFLDVTWRMAVPVVLFAGIGLLADRQFGTKPWVTLLGCLIGFTFASLLVQRQIKAIPKDDIKAAMATAKKHSDDDDLDD